MLCNGYSVVSLPELNFDETNEIELFRYPPQIGGVYYGGFQRKPFGNIRSLYREKKLPDDIARMYSRIAEFRNAGLYDYYVTDSYIDARSMMSYLNAQGDEFEVIGLCSKKIEMYLGSHNYDGGSEVFKGYDVDTGGYSAILTCLFEQSELFNNEISLMNNNGLLPDIDAVTALLERYKKVQQTENIEEIDLCDIDIVAIYSV